MVGDGEGGGGRVAPMCGKETRGIEGRFGKYFFFFFWHFSDKISYMSNSDMFFLMQPAPGAQLKLKRKNRVDGVLGGGGKEWSGVELDWNLGLGGGGG